MAYLRGTELPYKSEYYQLTTPGIYKSIASGEPLFSSRDKCSSGVGWPTFTKCFDNALITEHPGNREDGTVRTEVSCSKDGVHLGLLLGERYVIKGACL